MMNGSRKTLPSRVFVLVVALGAALFSGVPAGVAATASADLAMSHDAAGEPTGPSTAPRYLAPVSGWATVSAWECHVGQLCLFMDVDGGGYGYAWQANGYHSDFSKLPCPDPQSSRCNHPVIGTFDNEASSWWNRTSQNFCVSDGYFGGNPDNTMPAGTWGNFTTTNWNDRASSLGYLNCP